MEHAVENAKHAGHRVASPLRAPAGPTAGASLHPMLQLQQQAGNQAIQELLRSRLVQTKLAISQPDDPEEHEADRVAHQVMRSHGAPISHTCSCEEGGEMCEECQHKRTIVQRRSDSSHARNSIVSVREYQRSRAFTPTIRLALSTLPVSKLSRKSACGGCGKEECAQCRASNNKGSHRRAPGPLDSTNAASSASHAHGHGGAVHERKTCIDAYGCAWCNESRGVMQMAVDHEHCAGDCVKQHEQRHVDDDPVCCERYGRCVANAPTGGRQQCDDAWQSYSRMTSDWTECNAYYVERNCLLDIVNKRCKGGEGGLDENCCAELQRQLTFVDQKSNQHCPKSVQMPCPFAEDGSIMRLSTTPGAPASPTSTTASPGSPSPDSSAPQPSPADTTPQPGQRLSRKCACGGEAEEESQAVAREAANNSSPATSHQGIEQVLRSPGQPLDSATRAFFEPRFGHDFSSVRVHTDSAAGESAQAIHAHAYTAGNNIAFAPGKYNPQASDGQELLAHELTHTIQQGAAPSLGTGANQPEVAGSNRDVIQRQADSSGGAPAGCENLGLLGRIMSVLNNPIASAVGGAVFSGFTMTIQLMMPLLTLACEIYQHPDRYIAALREALGELVANAVGPARAAATAAAGSENLDCVLRHLEPKLTYMAENWWDVLKNMGWDLLWPWPGVAEDFSAIWRLLQDMWDNLTSGNFNDAGDDATAILRHLNAAAGRLYGWFLLASVLIGSVLGAVAGAAAGGVGALPGALAGAGAGLEFAGSVGYVLLISTIIIEGLSILKAAANLASDGRTDAQKECDCEVIASSALTLGITGAMAILGALASRFARALIQRYGSRVWRLPARRPAGRTSIRTRRVAGRQGQEVPEGPQSRGDVVEARVTLAEAVRNVFRRRSVTITDTFSTADNLPGIDFAVDSQIQLRSQTSGNILQDLNAFDDAIANGERVEVTVNGGRVFQVKSHGPVANILNTIDREIQNLGNFQTGSINNGALTATVTNPAERVLVEFLQQPLSAAETATLQARATAAGVRLQIVTGGFPPGHPAVVPFEQLPSILPELAQAAPRTVPQTGQPGAQGPGTVVCDIERPQGASPSPGTSPAPSLGADPRTSPSPSPSTAPSTGPTPSPSVAPTPGPSPSVAPSPAPSPGSAPTRSSIPVAREALADSHHVNVRPQSLLSLQQQAGNQAVQHLLRSGAVQTKLSISSPGDAQEQQADQVADQVMRARAGAPAAPCACAASGETCEECQHKREEVVARKIGGANSAPAAMVQRQPKSGTPQPLSWPTASQPVRQLPADFNNPQNVQALAEIMWHEMRGHIPGATAVGSIVVNRLLKTKFHKVSQLLSFEREPGPSASILDLACKLLTGQVPDTTNGSESYFSPRSMPDASNSGCCKGQSGTCSIPKSKGKLDCDLGLQTVPGSDPPQQRFFPSFAKPGKRQAQPAGTDPMQIQVYQPKLAISRPADPLEQEADQVAEQVMRAHTGAPAAPCACAAGGEMCEECQHKREEVVARKTDGADSGSRETLQRRCSCGENEETVQAAPAISIQRSTAGPSKLSDPTPMIDRAVRSPGAQLDSATRDFMESRFRHDFSAVQIHTDEHAARSAEEINAVAYTAGNHVVFARGQYSPDSHAGRHLLAHELTHVVQQGSTQAGPYLQRQSTSDEENNPLPDTAPPSATDVPSHTQGEKSGGGSQPSSPACPHTPTGLGAIKPAPPCEKKPTRDIDWTGRHFHFCADSDVLAAETPASIATFVGKQASDANYTVHGYASSEGAIDYNRTLACHRANRIVTLLIGAGVTRDNIIEVASKGPTNEFPGGQEFNRVAVVLAEVPPERRFGQFRPDPACPKTPTNLGDVQPDPPCPEDPRNLGEECKNVDPNQAECGTFLFCLDSDIFASPETPGEVMKFARRQPAASHFSVQGFTSDEGKQLHDYNLRLSCHRAVRLARELMKYGVPSEQIDIAAKGPTTQFGGPEANRAGVVRARHPNLGPSPKISPTHKMTPDEKHAIVDMAVTRLNAGGYRLGADAYISFWTCSHVPTVRHAVNTTHWYVEGDPGVPKYQHYPFTTDPPTSGEAGGRLGLNAAVVSDDVFYDNSTGKPGTLEDVMVALIYLSFFDKVSDEDFGTERSRGSERDEAATFTVQQAAGAPGQDPRKDKPAPKCTKTPGPTYKGAPAPGETGRSVPTFEVNESGFRGGSGNTVFLSPLPGNKGSMETDGNALSAQAKVTLHGNPQEFQYYDVGYILTIVEDHTDVTYREGEKVSKGVPVPLRDTDGLHPTEPWYSDGAFETAKKGHVEVSMSKAMAEEMALAFQAISGEQKGKAGSPLESAEKHSQYQLWLVARRRGEPLDRFSTHFLSGTLVDFTQNLDASGKSATGKFKTSVPVTGADSSQVRLSGPTPQDLGTKETTTSNVISSCTVGFGKVKFEVDEKDATGVTNVVFLRRQPMTFKGQTFPGLSLLPNPTPVHYQPVVTMRILDAKAPADKFEVGLIQNVMEYDWQNRYTTGEVASTRCTQDLPIRDSDEKAGSTDDVFMANHEPELAQLSLNRRQARLKLSDVPGGDAMLNLTDNPFCQGKKNGTLNRILANARFRTWVAARFNQDKTCLNFLHRIDWTMKYEATANPDNLVSAELTPRDSDDSGSPAPTLQGLANTDCGTDYSGPCK